nr:hypothetical protein B0A51_17236 [Rachicladosporium sp. CCFEE 5018]OQO16114.1 hypothetical protein B0A51_16884 [Rachicladosporium sp. CCFEE 5018]OQO19713.1 hypothetical protein B0A51_12773 [Rachicladosporium sp. CCFEE 5018]
MPLDTSTYSLARLRLDGRRAHELRRLAASLHTQAAADGSAYFEQGNTKVICTVAGPSESKRRGGAYSSEQNQDAIVEVEVNFAGFSGTDRRKRARGDKRTAELAHTISSAFTSTLLLHLYPHSTITLTLHVLSQSGSLLATCLNASTLALIDAGIPMLAPLAAVTVATTAAYADNEEEADVLLDVNEQEEVELPFLTIAGTGEGEGVRVLVLESRVQMGRLEGMIAVGLEGARRVRGVLDGIVREHGERVLEGKVG